MEILKALPTINSLILFLCLLTELFSQLSNFHFSKNHKLSNLLLTFPPIKSIPHETPPTPQIPNPPSPRKWNY